MLKIGLTGGVASGKSTVTDLFVQLGAVLIDTDVVSREVVAPGEPGLAAIHAEFGPSVITPEGTLDRRALRSIVFNDATKRRRLEAILHPLIRARVLAQLAHLEQRDDAPPYAIIAVPLLVETNFGELVDRVLVVDCAVETQIQRLTVRDGMTAGEAQAMIDAQVDRATRLEAADDIVDNSGDLAATKAQVERLHRRYVDLATVCRRGSGHAE